MSKSKTKPMIIYQTKDIYIENGRRIEKIKFNTLKS